MANKQTTKTRVQENACDDQGKEPIVTQHNKNAEQSELDEQGNQPVEPVFGDEEIADVDRTSILEAVLFCADEPIIPRKLMEITGLPDAKEATRIVEQLNDRYEQAGCSFRIEQIAGGYQMLTLPRFNPWLQKLLKVRSEAKLSPAALETLAIVAYKQPIMRVDVEAIRGVAAGEMLRQLMEKGLVKIAGRAEELGRPLLYGTTKHFLEVFGLNSLKDLPNTNELKRPE